MKKLLRYLGLGLVTIVAAIYGFILIGGLFEDPPETMGWESIVMAILSSLTLIAAVVSWLRINIGVWMTLGMGVLFTIFALITAGQMVLIALAATGIPLLLGGGLMLVSLSLRPPAA